jgi:putative acetyltransferase
MEGRSTQVRVREYRPDDAADLAQIFFESVRRVGCRHYSDAQVEAWAPTPAEPDSWSRRASDGRITLVAVDGGDRPIAYGDLELDGHIDHLYSSLAAIGKGAAAAIYEDLEQRALALGLKRLYVEASEGAVKFFERKGFKQLRRNDFQLRGVKIHNYSLEKLL